MKRLLLPALLLMSAVSQAQVKPDLGMVISKSTKIKKGIYELPNQHPDPMTGAVMIKGDNITVDFGGATLRGTPVTTEPDRRYGTCIRVEGRNVTIKNVNVHGYKNAIVAFNSPGLKILDSDLSYNWKQRLKSTLEREDLSDWMSYHKNDNDEWLKGNEKEGIPAYGGAMYLHGCDRFEVKNVRVTGGQNALMMTRSNHGKVWNNDFSFNSSLGMGMYRSSDNVIMHNKIDWCVRGYSNGVYNRGQDSAGILIYEQSHRNTFAYNSVTHGGDGFFLWAGQTTMDTGQGGCNDNLLYGNDFSHAPTNGIEVTFSRNKIVNNLMDECWHGIWGGYSYDTLILGNHFGTHKGGSEQAIAIEHGQNNEIRYNQFGGNKQQIVLWMTQRQDPNWGYPKARDTKSRDYNIAGNWFIGGTEAFNIRDTANVAVRNNRFDFSGKLFELKGSNPGLVFSGNFINGPQVEIPGAEVANNEWDPRPRQIMTSMWQPMFGDWSQVQSIVQPEGKQELMKYQPEPLKDGKWPFIGPSGMRGRQYMLIDEWGPYDFRSPKLWPKGEQDHPEHGKVQKFSIFGPKGKWRAKKISGLAWHSADSGEVPGSILVKAKPGEAADVMIELEYTGSQVVSPFGQRFAAGKPYAFSYRKFTAPIDWSVKWFSWDAATDPRTEADAFARLLAGTPIKEEKTSKLEYAWPGAIGPGLPSDHFATLAEGSFSIARGTYVLHVTTDDGARVWVDGKLVIADAWKYQGPTPYQVELKLGGKHQIRVEHFEIDGYSTLQVKLEKKR